MTLWFAAAREYLRSSLWFIPSLCVVASIGLAAGTLAYDSGEHAFPGVIFSGSISSLQSTLSTIATAVISLAALVFSVTMLVLQLASSQYSPRVLRTFLRDVKSQLALGVFLSTFAVNLVVLLSVQDKTDDHEAFYPELSVDLALIYAAVTLGFFVVYIHHLPQSMRVPRILSNVAAETTAAIERLYPSAGEPLDHRDPDDRPDALTASAVLIVFDRESGYVQGVAEDRLLSLARDHDVIIELLPMVGDFMPRGGALFRIFGANPHSVADDACSCLQLGKQRTMQQDVDFGFRQLVDIAEKALSPGINDPTTAVQVVDRLHQLLLSLARRSLPTPYRTDESGALRLVLPTQSWAGYVRLAFDEIRHYGEGSIQVARRLNAMADDLLRVVPPARRLPVEEQLRLLASSAERGFHDEYDITHAKRESGHG